MITQEIFETYCPAFRDPLGETFNNVRPYLEAATADLHERFAPGDHLDDVKDAAEAFVCYSAAYEATPALDLIATHHPAFLPAGAAPFALAEPAVCWR